MKSYRDLSVWQVAMEFAEGVYKLTETFPASEKFGLTSQVRRAAVSIPSNIAEGYGRAHRAEYLQHLSIARGSLMEAETQLTLAVRLGFVPREKVLPLWELAQRAGQMLPKLIAALRSGKIAPTTTRNPKPGPRTPNV